MIFIWGFYEPFKTRAWSEHELFKNQKFWAWARLPCLIFSSKFFNLLKNWFHEKQFSCQNFLLYGWKSVRLHVFFFVSSIPICKQNFFSVKLSKMAKFLKDGIHEICFLGPCSTAPEMSFKEKCHWEKCHREKCLFGRNVILGEMT